MRQKTDLREIIGYLNPAELDYQEWVSVGMALKHEGYPVEAWDSWSRDDRRRYHAGECEKKWNSFHGSPTPVTAGTIVQMAKERGWRPAPEGGGLGWDDEIDAEEPAAGKGRAGRREIKEPPGPEWEPVKEMTRYLETLFEAGENVGYVTSCWEKKDEKGTRWTPKKGSWSRTAGELVRLLNQCKGDTGAVLGDYNPKAGAWIRFNPLDGKGCRNENVTDFRYALVESDSGDLERQNAIIRELELPVACMVFSGKKSIHAIVRINAADHDEYRRRVEYLYRVCQENGLEIDTQNKNPSRLSRLPGVMRDGRKQYIIDTDIGKKSWEEWHEWAESANDGLPEPESLGDVWDSMPELAPPLIENVLRQGHKMLVAGPSKAGKSFALTELCIAVAEGRRWLGFPCAQGKVMYVNLELDRASCLHRFRDVYQALGWPPENLPNIDIWNLRGKAVPMDRLAPKLIRRASRKNYTAVVIDPIYKIITGDENSADQMARFCNQFDKVCTELNTAVIYCHHHSKGSQGGKKSMDRASGSGVFARDPDAMLDLIELDVPDALRRQEEDKAACETCRRYLDAHCRDGWEDGLSRDDLYSRAQMEAYCGKRLTAEQLDELEALTGESLKAAGRKTAWRIDGILREFPKFEPVNLWFDYPVHRADESGALKDVQPESEKAPWQKAAEQRKDPEKKQKERKDAVANAFEAGGSNGQATLQSMAEFMGVSEKTVRNRLKEHGGFTVNEGIVKRKKT